MKYRVEQFNRHYAEGFDGSSTHTSVGLEARLNALAAEGWRLLSMQPISIGWLLIMERDK